MMPNLAKYGTECIEGPKYMHIPRCRSITTGKMQREEGKMDEITEILTL